MKLQLIDNWRDAWRMTSNVASCLLGALSLVQSDLLPYVQPLVPAAHWPKVVAAFAVVIVVCRLIKQPGLHPPEPVDQPPREGSA